MWACVMAVARDVTVLEPGYGPRSLPPGTRFQGGSADSPVGWAIIPPPDRGRTPGRARDRHSRRRPLDPDGRVKMATSPNGAPYIYTCIYIYMYHIYIHIYMAWHGISCHVMSCHVMSCHFMSRHVTSYHTMSCHVTSCHVMFRHVTSYHVMSRHVTSCHLMSPNVT